MQGGSRWYALAEQTVAAQHRLLLIGPVGKTPDAHTHTLVRSLVTHAYPLVTNSQREEVLYMCLQIYVSTLLSRVGSVLYGALSLIPGRHWGGAA